LLLSFLFYYVKAFLRGVTPQKSGQDVRRRTEATRFLIIGFCFYLYFFIIVKPFCEAVTPQKSGLDVGRHNEAKRL